MPVSAGCEYMDGKRGSGVVRHDVLEMSGLPGVRVVGGVCEMCMRLALAGVGGVGERIGFGIYQCCRNSGSGSV